MLKGKVFASSQALNVIFIMLINVKMPTILVEHGHFYNLVARYIYCQAAVNIIQ